MEWQNVFVTVVIVSLCFFAVPIKINPDTETKDIKEFETYIICHNKSYKHNPDEYEKRFERFQKSLRQIERLNKLRKSEKSALYGLTEYSDLSEDEFMKKALRPDLSSRCWTHLNSVYHKKHRNHRVRRATKAPSKFDWREKGVVTPVKSQGLCGACWAFSTVEVVESMFAIKNGTLKNFSVQEMIDCAKNNFGCEGGDICSLLSWLMSTKSMILNEAKYPLTRVTSACKLNKKNVETSGVFISDFTCDSFVDAEHELLESLSHGPVAVAVNAMSWQNYLGGIIQYHCDGSFENLNHAVQIVGYENTATSPFYIVRNSWGSSFGDKGYLYIGIGSNLCGIANQVSSLDIM